MTYILYLIISIILVILQTTDLSGFLFFNSFYDLLIPIVIYVGLFRSVSEGLPVILGAGYIMDSFSGGVFGIYVTIYFWLYIGVRWIIQYFHSGSIFLMPIVLAVGVLIENFILLGAVAMVEPDWELSAADTNNIALEFLLMICTGPFYIMCLNYTFKKWDKILSKFMAERSEFG